MMTLKEINQLNINNWTAGQIRDVCKQFKADAVVNAGVVKFVHSNFADCAREFMREVC